MGGAKAKKDPNKPRGKMTAYAYFVQTCRDEHKKKHPGESVVFAEFSRKCADRWKQMQDPEKVIFQKMAGKDAVRYEKEMQHYCPPPGDQKAARGKRRRKDPNAPKRPQSAFFLFCHDRRAKIKEENQGYSVGDIAKELGKQWAAVTPELKKKYEDMGAVAKAEYLKVMEKYKAEQLKEQQKTVAAAKKPKKEESSSSSSSSDTDSDSN